MGGCGRGSRSGAIFGWPVLPGRRPSPGPMAPRPLSPLVLALGGAAAVLGSVLFILWKTYFGRGRERRWDQSEAWWGAEPAHLPEWDEWDVSAGPGSAPPRVRPRGVSATLSARSTRVGTWRRGPGAGERVAGSRESRNQGVGGRLWGGRRCRLGTRFLAGAGAPRAQPATDVGTPPLSASALPAPALCARPGGTGRGPPPPSLAGWPLGTMSTPAAVPAPLGCG